MIEALMKEYPHLDHWMVESLVKAYEDGTLEKYDLENDQKSPPKHVCLKNSINVEPEKNVD